MNSKKAKNISTEQGTPSKFAPPSSSTPSAPTRGRSQSMNQSIGSPGLTQSRDELIARYEFLADQYQASLNERDELKRQKRNLELEVASINKQQARLQELLESVKADKASSPTKPK